MRTKYAFTFYMMLFHTRRVHSDGFFTQHVIKQQVVKCVREIHHLQVKLFFADIAIIRLHQ